MLMTFVQPVKTPAIVHVAMAMVAWSAIMKGTVQHAMAVKPVKQLIP